MSGSLWLLIACVVVMTAWLVTTVWIVVQLAIAATRARDDAKSLRERVVSALVRWPGEHVRSSIAWACLIVLYVALRWGLHALTP